MTIHAHDLMIFLGAGASRPMPSGLPTFNELRANILEQLELAAYARTPAPDSDGTPLADGLAPEPFMLALSQAGVHVERWLQEVLGGGEPNVVHRLVAELARHGARVWTVNFDHLVETAVSPPLVVAAWPDEPHSDASVFKPHGSLGGSLIVTAEQVLAGLDDGWLRRLQADVAGRTVVFLGYSGRDLDFQPNWDNVLQGATRVLWFDFPDRAEQDRKRIMLRAVEARGALEFPPPAPVPSTVAPSRASPSWDFVTWCAHNDLGVASDADRAQLFRTPPTPAFPSLPGDRLWARPAALGLLGDHHRARNTYLAMAVKPRYTARAVRAAITSTVNHGSTPVVVALRCARALTVLPGLRRWRQPIEVKRLSILANLGQHDKVLAATVTLPPRTVSTPLILRSAALRMTGSLDEAANVAAEAYERALAERHPIRVANAAFQKCFALLWSERLDEAHAVLENEFAPRAQLAAVRWLAWSDFLHGQLAVRGEHPDKARRHFAGARARFASDGLVDGVVSARIADLAALRQLRADDEFVASLAAIERLISDRHGHQRYYTRRHLFTVGTIQLERAEFARAHRDDLTTAKTEYTTAANSPYRLISALGHLGLAMIHHASGTRSEHARNALDIATTIHARLIERRARLLLEPHSGDATAELFFC